MTDEFRPSVTEVFEFYGARVMPGSGWCKATCPLPDHDDRSPSASVNEEAGKWQCWVCDEKGDVFDVIGRNEGVGFAGAKQFAKEHFADGGGVVRQERVRGSGLLVRPGHHRGDSDYVPPWRRGL